MPYTRDVSNLPEIVQSFIFSGDNEISAQDYDAAMRNTYLSKVPLASALMNHYGVPFDDEDQERVKRLIVAMGWLDLHLDESPVGPAALDSYNALVSGINATSIPSVPPWVRPELLTAMKLVQNSFENISQKTIISITNKALRIGEISTVKSSTSDAKAYLKILTEEGLLSSDLAIEVLSSTAKANSKYKDLHDFNRTAMIAATLLDASIDLRKDYNDGLTAVKPSLANRLTLVGRTARYVPAVIAGLGVSGIRSVLKVGLN